MCLWSAHTYGSINTSGRVSSYCLLSSSLVLIFTGGRRQKTSIDLFPIERQSSTKIIRGCLSKNQYGLGSFTDQLLLIGVQTFDCEVTSSIPRCVCVCVQRWHGVLWLKNIKYSLLVGSDIKAAKWTRCSGVFFLPPPHISACRHCGSVHTHLVLVGVKLCRSRRAGGWLSNRRRRQAAQRWSGKKTTKTKTKASGANN